MIRYHCMRHEGRSGTWGSECQVGNVRSGEDKVSSARLYELTPFASARGLTWYTLNSSRSLDPGLPTTRHRGCSKLALGWTYRRNASRWTVGEDEAVRSWTTWVISCLGSGGETLRANGQLPWSCVHDKGGGADRSSAMLRGVVDGMAVGRIPSAGRGDDVELRRVSLSQAKGARTSTTPTPTRTFYPIIM
jgi:hypothetical protein